VNEGNGTQFLGFGDLYSQYTIDVTTGKIWNAMTDAERMESALNIRKVSWSGVNVNKDVPRVLLPGEPTLKVNQPASLGNLLVGPAGFGQPYGSPSVTGDVVLGDDGVADPSTTNGCTPLVNAVAGKIVLLDRGVCTFVVKVKNAQNAGAIAVLIADNVAGSPPAGLGGADPTITIQSGRITLADGNAIKANLASGVNVTLEVDTTILAGQDRVMRLMLLATFDPVLLGSSISHYDGISFRNQLMEPAINSDLTSSVTPPEDLTTSLFTDIGWYSDRDGVPDGIDQCIRSDTRPTVIIETCDSRAGNDVLADGCTLSDELIKCEMEFDGQPAEYLRCVLDKTVRWAIQHIVTPREAVRIQICAVLSLLH